VNHILTGYTAHAVKLGVPFLLSMEAFRTLLAGSCHYCGSAPTNLRREKNLDPSKREFAYNGIDRIDNSAGYYSGNCVSCCRNCNYAKRKLSYDDFISLAKNIAARFSRDTDAIKILDATKRIYIASTGAGAGLQSLLWSVPGISKVLIGASFPYAEEATNHFLGFKPESYCSKHTAICMALEAYYRAIQTGNALAVGLGLTASVASRESHRGDHRVFISTVTNNGCWIYTATLVKGSGPEARKRDGDTCDTLGMAALLEAVGLEDTTNIEPSLLSFEKRECTKEAMDVLLEYPLFTASGKRQKAPSNGNGVVLFPGAFNPPHEGHYWMAREHQATFHITRDTPHKPTLGIAEVLQRAKLLEGYNRLFTTGDPLYIDKARRFPGSTILVGVDAIQRMLDPNWGPDVPEMLNTFRSLGIRFLVADRMLDGKLITLDDITGAPKDICQRILRPAQHLAMSSTKIREAVNA
jgi:nicotinamide mononucleotide (NMN) deamidase PncC